METNDKLKYMALGGAIVAGLFLFKKTKKYITYGAIGYFLYTKYKSGQQISLQTAAELPQFAQDITQKALTQFLPSDTKELAESFTKGESNVEVLPS